MSCGGYTMGSGNSFSGNSSGTYVSPMTNYNGAHVSPMTNYIPETTYQETNLYAPETNNNAQPTYSMANADDLPSYVIQQKQEYIGLINSAYQPNKVSEQGSDDAQKQVSDKELLNSKPSSIEEALNSFYQAYKPLSIEEALNSFYQAKSQYLKQEQNALMEKIQQQKNLIEVYN